MNLTDAILCREYVVTQKKGASFLKPLLSGGYCSYFSHPPYELFLNYITLVLFVSCLHGKGTNKILYRQILFAGVN
mgnify:CR=1 FL=1